MGERGIIGSNSQLIGIILLAIFGWFINSSYSELIPTETVKETHRIINITAVEQESTIGIKEDIAAREAYLLKLLADPQTGKIPSDIRSKVRHFVNDLPKRSSEISNTRRNTIAEISETDWTSNGPFFKGGRTRALALDVLNNDVILAGGTSGGMWISRNKGLSWVKTTNNNDLHSVTSIAQDVRTGKENIWYYGTGELSGNSARGGGGATFRGDGVFKSTDGGNSWQLLESTSAGEPNSFSNPFQFIWKIVTNANNSSHDEVLVASFGGIIRSLDGGLTWEYVLGEASNESSIYTDIEITSSGVYYAAMSSDKFEEADSEFKGIYRSTNGVDWIAITPPGFASKYDRIVIGSSPSNPNVSYFIVDSDPNDLWKYTYLNGDGSGTGGLWENLTANIPAFGGNVGDFDSQGSYNMMLEVHPENENIVFLGGTNLYRSTDGFASSQNTEWVGGYNNVNDISDYPGHHPDQHVLEFFQNDPDSVISGHDGGISISSNITGNAVNWQFVNNGYLTTQFYTIAINDVSDEEIIIGGIQDNGSVMTTSNSASAAWTRVLGGDGGYAALSHQGENFYVSSQNSRIIRFTKIDGEFNAVSRIDAALAGKKEGQEYLFVNPFVLDPHNNSRMYLAGGDKVWRNNNITQIPSSNDSTVYNWFPIDASTISSGQVSSLAISREPKNQLYFGTSDGQLFKIEDPDTYSPIRRNITAGIFPNDGYISCVAINPMDADKVIVVFSNYNVQSIFYSEDGGISFNSISGNMEENFDGSGNGPSVRWATIIPMENTADLYLIGTSTGVYSTTSLAGNNTIWGQEGADVMGNIVVPMIQYNHSTGKVVVASHGNGVFQKSFDNVKLLPSPGQESSFTLEQNFPNPFTDFTTIRYTLPETSAARIRIYNEEGKKVRTLLLTTQYQGQGEVIWDGKDGNGANVTAGLYYCRMDYGSNTFNRETLSIKIILNR